MSNPILVVDQVLTTVAGDPSQQAVQDYLLSMVFANAAARAARDSAADGDRTQAFASQWSDQLGNLGWVITQAGSMEMSSTGSQPTTVAKQIASQAGSPAILDGLAALKALAGSEAAPDEALADMFWNAAADGEVFVGSIGQISAGADGAAFELATCTLRLDQLKVQKPCLFVRRTVPLAPTSAAALFVPVVAASVDLTVSHISASLPASLFDSKRSDLIAKLGGRIADHYRALPAGLVTMAQ